MGAHEVSAVNSIHSRTSCIRTDKGCQTCGRSHWTAPGVNTVHWAHNCSSRCFGLFRQHSLLQLRAEVLRGHCRRRLNAMLARFSAGVS